MHAFHANSDSSAIVVCRNILRCTHRLRHWLSLTRTVTWKMALRTSHVSNQEGKLIKILTRCLITKLKKYQYLMIAWLRRCQKCPNASTVPVPRIKRNPREKEIEVWETAEDDAIIVGRSFETDSDWCNIWTKKLAIWNAPVMMIFSSLVIYAANRFRGPNCNPTSFAITRSKMNSRATNAIRRNPFATARNSKRTLGRRMTRRSATCASYAGFAFEIKRRWEITRRSGMSPAVECSSAATFPSKPTIPIRRIWTDSCRYCCVERGKGWNVWESVTACSHYKLAVSLLHCTALVYYIIILCWNG